MRREHRLTPLMALLLALSASAVAAQGAPPDVAAPAAPIDAPAVPADAPAVPADAPAVPAATEDTGAATAEPADSGDGETASVEATAGDQAVTAITPTPSVVAPVPGTEEASNEFSYHVEAGSPERFGVEKLSATVTQNALQPNYGFASVRVQLANGYARKVPVTLSFTSSDSSRTVTRRVELRPHERLSVLLPTPQTSGGDLFLSTPEGVTKHRVYFGRANHRAMLLVGTPAQLEQSLGSDSSDPSAKLSVFPISPEELPSELSTLVGYDGILLTGARLEDLPQAQARALEAYAATGGYLALMAPGPGTAARLPMLRRTGDGVQTYGFGEVRLCSERRGACAKAVGREVLEHQPPVRPAEGQRYLRQDGVYGASLARRFLLPQAVPPVGRFLVIIAVFALVIGPGSLLIARRYGPSMLLFSIPATAVLTCLLIVSYSLVVDGFGTHANTFALTLLDRKNARAVTVGAGGFYANLAPRASRFGSTSAVVLPWGDEKGGVSVDWTEGATFGGDLVPSRLYRELGLLSVDPSRARLVVKREGGRVRVQNGLGSTVRWAVVRSGDELLEVRDLSDGGESTATKGATQASLSRWEDEVREPSMRFGQLARVRLKMELENGEFLALLDGPGPLPLGGITAEHHDSRHLVRGEVE